jgi:hypothetical protein
MILPSCEEKTAHSVCADPSSSRPTCPVFLVLAQVVPALNEHWLGGPSPPGGLGPPSPLSPSWPHFPQVPGNSPLPCRAQSHYESFWQIRPERVSKERFYKKNVLSKKIGKVQKFKIYFYWWLLQNWYKDLSLSRVSYAVNGVGNRGC